MHPTSSFARTALVLMLIAISFDARAAPAGSRERESPEKQQYRALIDDAVAEYAAHHFEESRALFRRAHQLEPSARTWRGIGMAAFELRDYVKSLRALEASLVDSRSPLTSRERDEVQALAARARVFVGHFVIHLLPKEAVLRVDDAPTALDDGDILMLESGHHVLTAAADDRRTETREINVVGGERRAGAASTCRRCRHRRPGTSMSRRADAAGSVGYGVVVRGRRRARGRGDRRRALVALSEQPARRLRRCPGSW